MPDDTIWQDEAKKKGLPEAFVEQLEKSDGVSEEEKAWMVRSVSSAAELAEKREKAIDHGRAVGEIEANSRRETGSDKDQRIKRAMAYAAWEFDGKPASSASQRTEFGVKDSAVTPSLERVLMSMKKQDA